MVAFVRIGEDRTTQKHNTSARVSTETETKREE